MYLPPGPVLWNTLVLRDTRSMVAWRAVAATMAPSLPGAVYRAGLAALEVSPDETADGSGMA
jgi:hypothetical protein